MKKGEGGSEWGELAKRQNIVSEEILSPTFLDSASFPFKSNWNCKGYWKIIKNVLLMLKQYPNTWLFKRRLKF